MKVPEGPKNSFRDELFMKTDEGQWETIFSGYSNQLQEHPWDGYLDLVDFAVIEDEDLVAYVLPETNKYVMYWDGELVDEILLQEVSDAGE